MSKMKKILNDPAEVVTEMLDGLVLAYDGTVRRLPEVDALVRTEQPDDKVALLIGGGSGHEPIFHGFLGHNMADGAACGGIFAAPSPGTILEATKAVHRGRGVLYLYGNYAGDNMNFDIAAELAEEEGIPVRTVRVWDDVASAPPDRKEERRGIAGDVYMVKIAGAAAAQLDSLEVVEAVAVKARANLRSLGVAVRAGSIPETGKLTFELPDDEIEIGMGAHGEAGVSRQKLLQADPLTDRMMEALLADMPLARGDEVAVLLNNLGATTFMEMLIVNRRLRAILDDLGVKVHKTDMGALVTSQEMAGFSISLLKLDAELKSYLDAPASCFAFRR